MAEDTAKIDPEALTKLEMTLTVLWNAVRRWMNQRGNSDGVNGLSELDVFLLHMMVYRNQRLRAVDLAFALAIEDMHLVTYSLKKLTKLGLALGEKIGKEAFYSATANGQEHYADFVTARRTYLEPALEFLPHDPVELNKINQFLRALSGAYEQAARAGASAKG
jgi:predicted MarR family transcription regulator